jgi:hypothetical protein
METVKVKTSNEVLQELRWIEKHIQSLKETIIRRGQEIQDILSECEKKLDNSTDNPILRGISGIGEVGKLSVQYDNLCGQLAGNISVYQRMYILVNEYGRLEDNNIELQEENKKLSIELQELENLAGINGELAEV